MKHLAKIQSEFLKEASNWDKMSQEGQKDYLQRHPKSKRKITAKPKSEDLMSRVQNLKKSESAGSIYEWDHGVEFSDGDSSIELDPSNITDFADQLDEISEKVKKNSDFISQSDNSISVRVYDPSKLENGQPDGNYLHKFDIDITSKDPKHYSEAANTLRKYKDFTLDVDVD
jgi:hypothetical protein